MNELKPEDVMRALELCKSCRDRLPCDGCPYFRAELGDDESCTNRMAQDALALLREKYAEIERLKKHQESVATVCNRANEHYNTLYEQAKEILKAEARAEAITEFAERAKRRLPVVSPSVFDKIANEMKGN